MPISNSTRSELVRRARDKFARTNVWTQREPCDWRPGQVAQPESGLPFTDVGAWNFIADLLEGNCEVQEVVLEKPQGKIAYVIHAEGYLDCPKIYIKLTLNASAVHGRSFHNSEY